MANATDTKVSPRDAASARAAVASAATFADGTADDYLALTAYRCLGQDLAGHTYSLSAGEISWVDADGTRHVHFARSDYAALTFMLATREIG